MLPAAVSPGVDPDEGRRVREPQQQSRPDIGPVPSEAIPVSPADSDEPPVPASSVPASSVPASAASASDSPVARPNTQRSRLAVQTPVDLEGCERAVGYTFADRGLLHRALVHSSAARTREDSNERLEFLGDAVFGAVVCEELFGRFPDASEGELTRIKSAVVSRRACAAMTRTLGLDRFVVLGKGVASRTGRIPGSILAAVYEAVVAAVYIDGGPGPAGEFIRRTTAPFINASVAAPASENYKSRLQQKTQAAGGLTPEYAVLDERGPDHSKSFRVAAVIGETTYPPAWGPSKKEAEQRAAGNALSTLTGGELPFAEEAEGTAS